MVREEFFRFFQQKKKKKVAAQAKCIKKKKNKKEYKPTGLVLNETLRTQLLLEVLVYEVIYNENWVVVYKLKKKSIKRVRRHIKINFGKKNLK